MTTGKRLISKMGKTAVTVAALGDAKRIAVISLLLAQSLELKDIAGFLKISRPLAFHHIQILLKGKWIVRERLGNMVLYRINDERKKLITAIFDLTP